MERDSLAVLGACIVAASILGYFIPRKVRTNRVNLKPVNDRIIILRDEAPELSPGGIYIPPTNQTPPSIRGTIVAVGSDVEGYDVDDVVFFPPYNGHEIENCGVKYLVLKADEVLAVAE